MEEVYEDSLSKVKKLVEESVSAEVKQQKTNLEKKVASLGKDTLKAFKKVGQLERQTRLVVSLGEAGGDCGRRCS